MAMNDRTALVLGANGGVGGEIASALLRRGWTVKALVRDIAGASGRWPRHRDTPVWVKGDAMDAASVLAAAQGVSLIVHAVNPPGYRDWEKLVLPMLDSTIEAAKAVGARVLLPGSVYNFGPDYFDKPLECVPQSATTRKGLIRIEMEARLRDAAMVGATALILRCGDFFGPGAANNWFSQGLVKPGRPVTAISNPGRKGVGHQWAYLPDVGETAAQLVERRDEMGAFEVFHMEGHWDADGTEMVEAIRRVAGDPAIRVQAFPWWMVTLASPFVPLFREIREMRYLWNVSLHMPNAKLVKFLGAEPHTDWDAAVRATLTGLGCIAGNTLPQKMPATAAATAR